MKTDWIQTYTGKEFYPLEPEIEKIDIEDIAHALSNICRYTGHCKRFYSVAQHSLIGAQYFIKLGDNEHAKQFLLHDASEAYLCDIARPVKQHIGNYKEYEDHLLNLIFHKHGLEYPYDYKVKSIDEALLYYEGKTFFKDISRWSVDKNKDYFESDTFKFFKEAFVFYFISLAPITSEKIFLTMYNKLFNGENSK
jgi:5'-deoxynucleotidase YfbR-like HD superfamily hydrolase